MKTPSYSILDCLAVILKYCGPYQKAIVSLCLVDDSIRCLIQLVARSSFAPPSKYPAIAILRSVPPISTHFLSYAIMFATSTFIALSLLGCVWGLPSTPSSLSAPSLDRRCGAVSKFYHPKPGDWEKAKTDRWLGDWIKQHRKDINDNPDGFSGALGLWALGNPDWNCRDDGSTTSCGLSDVCDNRVLNSKGDLQVQNTYYVLQSLTNLRAFFNGLQEAFETSAIATALVRDSWALDFYQDEKVTDDDAALVLKQVLTGIATVFGIVAAFAGAAGAAANSLVTGLVGFANNAITSQYVG